MSEWECWAVKVKPRKRRIGSADREFLAGRYYFDPYAKTACRIALFETRAEARAKAGEYKCAELVRTPVRVRVRVTVEPIEEDAAK